MNTHRQKSNRQPEHLSRRKRTAFLVVTVSVPILFFLLLEASLRLLHYGPNLSLFVTEEIGSRTFHIMNHEVRSRYFSRTQFTPNTSQDYFLLPKPAGTFRIFCLGGSTTVGFPYGYIGSFSTFLRDRLNILFPEKNIEVINLGMTATNSFTVLDIARELVNYGPDMFIVYDGHNEFYGALGVASHESLGSSRFLTNAYLRLIHFRTFLLLRDVVSRVSGVFVASPGEDLGGTMMERLARGQFVPYGSSMYRKARDIFKSNLQELKSICSEHSIPLVLGSQVSNLRTLPPFVSDETALETPDKRLAFNIASNRGLTHWLNGSFDSTLVEFRQALTFDTLHAATHYRIARTLDTLGQKREALAEYVKARDYDNLRFRTSSDFNDVIRSMADSNRVVVVDMERKFKANSPDSIIGSELILEHLHPNLRGYFLIAKEYVETMRDDQFIASAEEWNKRDTLTDNQVWSARSITELDEFFARRRIEFLTSGWPFVPEQKQLKYPAPSDTLGTIVDQVVQGKITWEQGHVAAAEYYESRGEHEKAEKQYLAIINQIPLNVSPYLVLGQLYLRMGRNDDARAVFFASLKIEPTAFAYRSLAALSTRDGTHGNPIEFLRQAFAAATTSKERTDCGFLLAAELNRAGRNREAIDQLQIVLRIDPNYTIAQQLLRKLTINN